MSMYLDDIQICSKSEDKHVQYLKRVLHVQRENQFHAKMAMCYFWKEKLHYLGHVLRKRALRWILRKLKLLQSGIEQKLEYTIGEQKLATIVHFM